MDPWHGECNGSDAEAAAKLRSSAERELLDGGATPSQAEEIAAKWVTGGDFLIDSLTDLRADFVLGLRTLLKPGGILLLEL